MTNLLAAIVVTMVTNVTEKPKDIWGPVACPDAKPMNGFTGLIATCAVAHHGVIGSDPNIKEVTTTIKRVTKGIAGTLELQREDVVTNWTVTLKKVVTEKWEPVAYTDNIGKWSPNIFSPSAYTLDMQNVVPIGSNYTYRIWRGE